jgi:lipopolysaccharide assembly outer membrane protein LptD (OstA)
MHVTWGQTATLDGKTNQVLIVGNVVASSHPPGGPSDQAQGGRLLLYLAQASKATQASDQSPASRPDDIGGADFDFMRNKQVQSFSFLQKAQMDSTLTDAQGNKLRELNLRGERIDYDNTSQKVTVPGAGIMLTYDHQVAATQPSSFGGQGTTRFDWQTRFIFDQSARTATIEGSVVIIHRDEGQNARQVRLDAPLVRAQFESQSATRPAQAEQESSLQLRRMTATGGVTVNTGDKTITAGDVEYDASHDQLICRAGEQGTVQLIDQLHPAGFNADEVWLNVKANTIEKIVNLSGRAR